MHASFVRPNPWKMGYPLLNRGLKFYLSSSPCRLIVIFSHVQALIKLYEHILQVMCKPSAFHHVQVMYTYFESQEQAMSVSFASHVQVMCTYFASHVQVLCTYFASHVHIVCKSCASYVHMFCKSCASYVHKFCKSYTSNVHIFSSHVQVMCNYWIIRCKLCTNHV